MTVDNSVVIVGRGPVGMTTALLLAQWGVASVIVDPMPAETTSPGSKAVLIAGHVIAMTEPIDVGKAIADEGLAWTISRTFIRDKEVLTADVSTALGHLPKVVNLAQKRVEELLLKRVHDTPLITLLPQSKVVDFEDTGDGVSVNVETPSGQRTLTTSWLIGCDGSRSIVRKKLGIPFEGYGHDEHFLIADISADLPFPEERHFYFDPPFNPGRTVLIHPQPGSTWHIDWQVGADVDAEDEKTSGRLDKRIRAVIGDVDYELDWITTYQFKQLRARDFRKGRCFLVGDAAHLTSPYGARGMNSGIADAEALAWRLAMVVRGEATESILESYSAEREYTAKENLEITGATARFMCPTNFWKWMTQRTILELARLVPPARRWINSGKFYEAVTYPPTLLKVAAEATAGIPVGTIAPDGLIRAADPGITRIGQLLRHGVALLVFPGRDPEMSENVVKKVLDGLPSTLKLIAVEVVRGTPSDTGHDRHVQVQDADGALQAAYCPDPVPAEGCAYIIRPDAYVSAHTRLDAGLITTALKSVFELTTIETHRKEISDD